MEQKSSKRIILVAGSITVLCLTILMSTAQQRNAQGFNGVLQAIQFFMCLLMVIVDYKGGRIVANILLGGALLGMVRTIIFMREIAPLPGVCNMLIYIVTLNLLSNLLKNREQTILTDFLTGLFNRRGLYQLLIKKVSKKKPFYVIYLDLKNFKMINDNHGHRYGDAVLIETAKRIKSVTGKKNVVCRIGGDEFVIITLEENPKELAEQILNRVEQKCSINLDGRMIDSYVTACAGVVKYPDDADNPDELLRFADIAMYQAAREKVDNICFFDKSMADQLIRQVEVEQLLKTALQKDYFYLVYQPQYLIDGKRLRGFETLLRLKTPDGVFVSPGEFIPVAEKSELILQIDQYVMKRAMREFKDILDRTKEDLILSINISAKNVASADFAERVIDAIRENQFEPRHLEIEITEYCLLQSLELTIDNINKLRSSGIHVALDDFGTGYTSLSYLAKLPINLLKLDKCLVDDIVMNVKSAEFVNSVVSLGHLMDCEVISEGVESEEQLELLKKQNCDYVQGFVWGKPMELEQARELIEES